MSNFISIGTDTELFARNNSGMHIALCGKIGGTKEQPLQIADLQHGFAIQEDNVAMEFNIPPCHNAKQFVDSIGIMSVRIKDILANLGLSLSREVSVSFDKTELTHPTALMFGCEPDYNIWTQMENSKPEAKDANLRTAGGHIHVGTSGNMVEIVQNMDLYLGVPSVLLDKTEGAAQRRELYGKAGAMRPKSYGLEYRVLSNFWVFDPNLVRWVFQQTVTSCDAQMAYTKALSGDIQDCINNGDQELAQKLVDKFNIEMPRGS